MLHKPTCLPVQSLCELVDAWGNLQTLVQNGSLSLDTDVLGPFHKSTKITLWLDIKTW